MCASPTPIPTSGRDAHPSLAVCEQRGDCSSSPCTSSLHVQTSNVHDLIRLALRTKGCRSKSPADAQTVVRKCTDDCKELCPAPQRINFLHSIGRLTLKTRSFHPRRLIFINDMRLPMVRRPRMFLTAAPSHRPKQSLRPEY